MGGHLPQNGTIGFDPLPYILCDLLYASPKVFSQALDLGQHGKASFGILKRRLNALQSARRGRDFKKGLQGPSDPARIIGPQKRMMQVLNSHLPLLRLVGQAQAALASARVCAHPERCKHTGVSLKTGDP